MICNYVSCNSGEDIAAEAEEAKEAHESEVRTQKYGFEAKLNRADYK